MLARWASKASEAARLALHERAIAYGPKADGTYVVEFRRAADEGALAISIPRSEVAVIRHFQERCTSS